MDGSMCELVCKLSKTCKRHEDSGSIPNQHYQSYALFTVQDRKHKNIPCDKLYYYKTLKRKKK